MSLRDVSHARFQLDVPDESYETIWREAQQALTEAGPGSGFVLLVLDGGDQTATSLHISTGANRVAPSRLLGVLHGWLTNPATFTGGE